MFIEEIKDIHDFTRRGFKVKNTDNNLHSFHYRDIKNIIFEKENNGENEYLGYLRINFIHCSYLFCILPKTDYTELELSALVHQFQHFPKEKYHALF